MSDGIWSAWREAQWLGLVSGWPKTWGRPLSRDRWPAYAAALRVRTVDFTGEGPMPEATRQAFLAALARPEAAPALLAPFQPSFTGPKAQDTTCHPTPRRHSAARRAAQTARLWQRLDRALCEAEARGA